MPKAATRRTSGQREPVALYHQLFLMLRDDILSGRRAFGSMLPTEEELAANYEVSRITARRALSELADAGLVERRRRIGTRVIHHAPDEPVEVSIQQAIDSLVSFGRKTTVRVVEFSRAPAPPHIAAALQIETGTPTIRAARLRLLDKEPLGYVLSHAPARLAPLITRKRLSAAPILDVLQSGGVEIGGAEQHISAVAADPHIAAELDIEARAPLLQISRIVLDKQGAPVLLTEAYYRGDRYHIRLDLGASASMHIES